jgi:chemotaxis protein MotD
MIELATTPQPAVMPSAVANGGGASRDSAPGFADLVTRQGSGRTSPTREAEGEAPPAARDDAAEPAGDREAAPTETDQEEATVPEDAPSWPARGLHKVLAMLFGDGGAPREDDVAPAPDAVERMFAETAVAPEQAPEAGEEDETEPGSEPATPDDPEDAEVPAGMAVMAAITLPEPPREQRAAGASAARQPEPSAIASRSIQPPAARQDEPGGQESGARSGGERRGEPSADAGKGRNAAPESSDMKVRVIGETVVQAPGSLQNQRTIADLVATIASDGDWTSAMERATATRSEAASTPLGPVRDLRIQLNPAELGTVEARLRIVGEQLSVEIRVESGEAFRRLSSERDAIISALRGLGFAVDDVSIQQQQPTSGQAQSGAGGRQNDTSGGLSQGTGRDQRGEGGTAGGQQQGGEQGGRNGDALTPATRAPGGGLYI